MWAKVALLDELTLWGHDLGRTYIRGVTAFLSVGQPGKLDVVTNKQFLEIEVMTQNCIGASMGMRRR
jgi:hypothetical protein